jgi:hypothetical protein
MRAAVERLRATVGDAPIAAVSSPAPARFPASTSTSSPARSSTSSSSSSSPASRSSSLRKRRARKTDEEWIESRRRKLGPRSPTEPEAFTVVIARKTWRASWVRRGDHSGRAAWLSLCQAKNRAAAGAIRRAALAGRRTWSSSYALNVLTLGLALLELSHATRRKSRWRNILDGIPIGALQELLRDPVSGKVPHRNSISGTHRPHATLQNGQLGYLRALELAGFCYTQQRRRCEHDPSLNTYWIVSGQGIAYCGAAGARVLLELIDLSYEIEHSQPGRAPPWAA